MVSSTKSKVTKRSRDEEACKTLIMFVDIINASEVSNHKTPEEYAIFVESFQTLFETTCKSFLSDWAPELEDKKDFTYKARGDEGILFIYPRKSKVSNDDLSQYVDITIYVALALKRDWLLTKENNNRINGDILPIDLGVGIHVGQTFVKFNKKEASFLPEGYAINLAKRVENHSRIGRFTRIMVSEAAHALLERLPDEKTYLFAEPREVSAKGFSREVRAVEIRHHFLPTFWADDVEDLKPWRGRKKSKAKNSRTERTRLEIKDIGKENVEYIHKAHKLNPTNTWIAEEYIKSSMIHELLNIYVSKGKDAEENLRNRQKMSNYYRGPADVGAYLVQSDQRDAGALMIQGLIEGERLQFDLEYKRYQQAEKFSSQLALLKWYEGVSCSEKVYLAIKGSTLDKKEFIKDSLDEFTIDQQWGWDLNKLAGFYKEAIDMYTEALEISPFSAWIYYARGCEHVMWGNARERKKGIKDVIHACNLLDDIKYYIGDEEYLAKSVDDDGIKKLIKASNK